MSGLELVKSAFRLEKTERVPWVPFIGVHAAKLINKNAEEFLQSEELIYKGVSEAIELYEPDGIPILFDLQLEAETFGCKLKWAQDNPPSVISHPLQEGMKIEDLQIPNNEGRIRKTVSAARRIKKRYPNVALYGLVTGPFTLALHLLGTDIFMKIFMEPDYVIKVLEFCKNVAVKMCSYYEEAGCDVIAVVDPMTSQIDPDSFSKFVSSPVSEIFNYIKKRDLLSSFFVCGNAQQNIEEMCKCKPDNISIDENIDLSFVKEKALEKNISFGGNIKLTLSLLLGSELDAQIDALECMDKGGQRGFILAPGCDIPMNTPKENLVVIQKMVQDEYQQQVIKALDKRINDDQEINPSEHWISDKLNIDIITLDSLACAPCQYMVEAVKSVESQFENSLNIKEYKIKEREGLEMMRALGVVNIPSICIEGKLVFSSQIPSKEILIDEIRKQLELKRTK